MRKHKLQCRLLVHQRNTNDKISAKENIEIVENHNFSVAKGLRLYLANKSSKENLRYYY